METLFPMPLLLLSGRTRNEWAACLLSIATSRESNCSFYFYDSGAGITPFRSSTSDLSGKFPCSNRSFDEGKDEATVREQLEKSGKHSQEYIDFVTPFKVFEGNRPSTSIVFPQLDPTTLGSLVSLFEHRIFVQGYLLNIFSFDQWELSWVKNSQMRCCLNWHKMHRLPHMMLLPII